MFAADDDTTVKCYGGDDPDSPYRFYYNQILTKLRCLNRHAVFKHDRDEPDDAITLDRLIEDCVIAGTVNDVVDRILALRDITGDFGELVYAGIDWADEAPARRSMQLMAEEVMPRVNDANGGSRAAD